MYRIYQKREVTPTSRLLPSLIIPNQNRCILKEVLTFSDAAIRAGPRGAALSDALAPRKTKRAKERSWRESSGAASVFTAS